MNRKLNCELGRKYRAIRDIKTTPWLDSSEEFIAEGDVYLAVGLVGI